MIKAIDSHKNNTNNKNKNTKNNKIVIFLSKLT